MMNMNSTDLMNRVIEEQVDIEIAKNDDAVRGLFDLTMNELMDIHYPSNVLKFVEDVKYGMSTTCDLDLFTTKGIDVEQMIHDETIDCLGEGNVTYREFTIRVAKKFAELIVILMRPASMSIAN